MFKDSADTNALNRDPKKTALIAALLVAGGIIFSSWYTIDESERGVLLRNGALVKVVEPGLSFKMPFFESVRRISIQSFSTKYEGLPAYSSDQQTANLTVSVSWRVDPSKVDEVYTRYRDVQGLLDRLITRNIQTQTENVFGQYTVSRRYKIALNLWQTCKKPFVMPFAGRSLLSRCRWRTSISMMTTNAPSANG